MRVYLPSTLPALADLLAKGEAGPPPVRAFAVTPALREAYAIGDDEELEYVALLEAARQSLRLLADDPRAPQRRVVLAADVPDGEVRWNAYDDEPATVVLGAPVPLAALVSGHIDDAGRRAGRGRRRGRDRRRRRGGRGRGVHRGLRRRARAGLVRGAGTS